MKNHKLGILKVRDNFQSSGEIESAHEFEFGGDDYAYRTYCNVCK